MARLIWGADLYKGWKAPKDFLLNGSINDIMPFQFLTLEEKTHDWVKAVADFYEMVGWLNVERKIPRMERNYMMRHGDLNHSDYIAYPTESEYHRAINFITPQESYSPLEQFYPIAPNLVDVLRGEYIKRDNTWSVEAIDPYSHAQVLEEKRQRFEELLYQQAAVEKQQTLAKMGLSQGTDPDAYQQQMQQFSQQMQNIEFEIKNFRTTGVKWAEKVLKVHEKRYNLHELDPDGFESGLITDSEFWHIDLLDDNFKIELLNPIYCDYHKRKSTKYVSDGDYFLWFDWMSSGDVVNKLGRRMKEEDLLKLKDIYVKSSNIMVADQFKNRQDGYYDYNKTWKEATDLNPVMNDAMLGQELAYNYMRTPNFDHNISPDIFNPAFGKLKNGHPQMFRIMRLYWRSMKRIGWLTKIDRDGTVHPPDWVDENYRVTIDPKYDKSVRKEETKDNLIYGEHIDWNWATEWRHVIKISPNQKHSFWLNSQNTLESIYIDGAPVKFQFKGINNPLDALPPVEGCVFSHINTKAHSFIDRIRATQILYNICMNKIPKKFLKDYGNKLTIDKRTLPTNNLSQDVMVDGKKVSIPRVDPLEEYEERLRESDIITYDINRESIGGLGQPTLPQVVSMSTVQEAQLYFQLAQEIKWEAGELVGVTRQRTGGQKASETAYSVQQGINYSETQTEKYYEQHGNLMQRVRQRMLDAAQYYSTFQETAQDMYLNESDENIMLSIIGMENLLPHYNINLVSKASVRSKLQLVSQFLQNENTLDILPSKKISALVEESLPKLLSLIREGELEAMQKEEAQRQQDQQQFEAQLQQQQQQHEEQLTHDDKQAELNRQKDIQVAEIRALGGIQTDVNADSIPDAQSNLNNLFKQQEIADKRQAGKDVLSAKRQSDIEKVTMAREKNQTDLQKEKIKAKAAITVAEKNKNSYDKPTPKKKK